MRIHPRISGRPVFLMGYLTNALHEGDEADFVREYQDIFINVKEWGVFDASNISRNGLRIYVDGSQNPEFVFRTPT
jgi:hypothetical protein